MYNGACIEIDSSDRVGSTFPGSMEGKCCKFSRQDHHSHWSHVTIYSIISFKIWKKVHPLDNTTTRQMYNIREENDNVAFEENNAWRLWRLFRCGSDFFLSECQTQADIAFLLDGSGSVYWEDFNKMKTFVKTMISSSMGKETQVRVFFTDLTENQINTWRDGDNFNYFLSAYFWCSFIFPRRIKDYISRISKHNHWQWNNWNKMN